MENRHCKNEQKRWEKSKKRKRFKQKRIDWEPLLLKNDKFL